MIKKKYICLALSSLLLLSGCSQINPTIETLSTSIEDTVAVTTEEDTIITTEEITEAETETTFISIDITTPAPETTSATSGHMEANNQVYEKNNVYINYPQLLGMTNPEAQEWANKVLYEDIQSLLKYYEVNENEDKFFLDYEVSTLYRGEFSLIYEGEFTKGSNGTPVKVKASESLDLAKKDHTKLSDRLAVSKVIKCIKGDEDTAPDYELVFSSVGQETLHNYLAQQDDDFFENMVVNADFGAKHNKLTGYFSYVTQNNVAIVIPLPHLMGDYAIISIKQQTK